MLDIHGISVLQIRRNSFRCVVSLTPPATWCRKNVLSLEQKVQSFHGQLYMGSCIPLAKSSPESGSLSLFRGRQGLSRRQSRKAAHRFRIMSSSTGFSPGASVAAAT